MVIVMMYDNLGAKGYPNMSSRRSGWCDVCIDIYLFWRHMINMASEIIGNSYVCSIAYLD